MAKIDIKDFLVNPPKTARGEKTLQRICKAAEHIFYKKGYHESSIHDIANEAGVSVGTFYIYFESKLMLYKYLLISYGHNIRRYLTKAIEGATSRREAERLGLKAWLTYVTENRYVFNITFESLFIEQKLFEDYFLNFSEAYVQRLDQAQEEGDIVSIDTEVASFALMGISIFVGLHWVYFGDSKNRDDVVDQVMKMIDGMFTDEKSD